MDKNKLIIENYLLVLKSTVEVFVHGTLESSNKNIRESLKQGLNDTLCHQADTYDLMTSYGWYTVDNVETNEISKLINKVSSDN